MVNRITRRVPISRYTVPYVLDGTDKANEKNVVFETLSDLSKSDIYQMAFIYIEMYEGRDSMFYLSSNFTEEHIGVFTYEMPLTHFILHSIRRGEKNIPKEE